MVTFNPPFKNCIVLLLTFVNEFANMLDPTPPPDRYLTVKVVLDGVLP